MHLREGEKILRIYHHHPTPFVWNIMKVIGGALPFFFLLFLFQDSLSTEVSVWAHVIVLAVFSLVVIYQSIIFWLDRLVVTNMRIYQIDWKYLTVRSESEAMLSDIQDVRTAEKGILSYFKALDYGMIRVETASSHVTLLFEDAPNPEGIRQFIYSVRHH